MTLWRTGNKGYFGTAKRAVTRVTPGPVGRNACGRESLGDLPRELVLIIGKFLLRIPRGVLAVWPTDLVDPGKVFWPLESWPEISWSIVLRAHFANPMEYMMPGMLFANTYHDYSVQLDILYRSYTSVDVEEVVMELNHALDRGDHLYVSILRTFLTMHLDMTEWRLDAFVEGLEAVSSWCKRETLLKL